MVTPIETFAKLNPNVTWEFNEMLLKHGIEVAIFHKDSISDFSFLTLLKKGKHYCKYRLGNSNRCILTTP